MISEIIPVSHKNKNLYNPQIKSFLVVGHDLTVCDVFMANEKGASNNIKNIIGKYAKDVARFGVSYRPFIVLCECLNHSIPEDIENLNFILNSRLPEISLQVFLTDRGICFVEYDCLGLRENVEIKDKIVKFESDKICNTLSRIRGIINNSLDVKIGDNLFLDHFGDIESQLIFLDMEVKKMLEFNMILNGQSDFQIVDFQCILNDILKSFTFYDGVDGIDFICDIQNVNIFYSDLNCIKSILCCLVKNSIKQRGSVEMESEFKIFICDNTEGVDIVIEDEMLDIPKEFDLQKIGSLLEFENKNKTVEFWHFVALHCLNRINGKIEFEKLEGQGTRIQLSLPNMVNSDN